MRSCARTRPMTHWLIGSNGWGLPSVLVDVKLVCERTVDERHRRGERDGDAVPMRAVVAAALAAYEQALFWQALDEGYARLAADPESWAGVTAERAGEAPALLDGLG